MERGEPVDPDAFHQGSGEGVRQERARALHGRGDAAAVGFHLPYEGLACACPSGAWRNRGPRRVGALLDAGTSGHVGGRSGQLRA
ncbi:hypothetical protein GCM10010215_03410 [Streptomyces virginiae]|uniref:Uncharacterized protein n=1 Tax=Streptomyces virginiae TaxID=1961 RepID=A0ABQ3NRK0_STRVG|nr:hypothetical protein GCM10010215_03410 [Streptomyces virginiae]GHI15398.1 hypothetical protein Scinn_48610 [Streptomyces virginiae]GLV92030.1 hypothetical protein Slala04_34840 [Streptomyces lavendulae subsp. lavendulae]